MDEDAVKAEGYKWVQFWSSDTSGDKVCKNYFFFWGALPVLHSHKINTISVFFRFVVIENIFNRSTNGSLFSENEYFKVRGVSKKWGPCYLYWRCPWEKEIKFPHFVSEARSKSEPTFWKAWSVEKKPTGSATAPGCIFIVLECAGSICDMFLTNKNVQGRWKRFTGRCASLVLKISISKTASGTNFC